MRKILRRTEQEMMELILSFARRDERIRAVGMNGSRVNANARKDRFQDYDIVYLVTDMKPFIENRQWLDYFGTRLIMQTPDDMALFPASGENSFAYLMLFEDGNRIDLTLMPASALNAYLRADSLTAMLLDKDGKAGKALPPTDRDYWVKKPSQEWFNDCCNEFFWVSTYVVKGLCRKELLYAAEHLSIIQGELLRMLSWKAGAETNFSASVGKSYKYLARYLDSKTAERLMRTFRSDTALRIRQSLFACRALFKKTAVQVANRLGFAAPDYVFKMTEFRFTLSLHSLR